MTASRTATSVLWYFLPLALLVFGGSTYLWAQVRDLSAGVTVTMSTDGEKFRAVISNTNQYAVNVKWDWEYGCLGETGKFPPHDHSYKVAAGETVTDGFPDIYENCAGSKALGPFSVKITSVDRI